LYGNTANSIHHVLFTDDERALMLAVLRVDALMEKRPTDHWPAVHLHFSTDIIMQLQKNVDRILV